MNFFARALAGLGVLLCLAGCAAAPTTSQLRPPQSFADFLLNLREVTRSGLILQEAFFTKENLSRALGASTVQVRRTAMEENIDLRASMSDFPRWRDVKPGEYGLTLGARWYRGFLSKGEPVGTIWGTIDGVAELSFEFVEQVYGKGWIVQPDPPFIYVPPHPRPPPPPATHPRGYSTIVYRLGSPGLDRSIGITFDGNGMVQSIAAGANQAQME